MVSEKVYNVAKAGVLLVVVKQFTNEEFKKEVEEIYSRMIPGLENGASAIISLMEETFITILQEENSKYKLLHNVGLTEGKYYKFSPRVKNKKSLGDKLIRKSDLLKIKSICGGSPEDVVAISGFLKDRYTDLIGIKILGDLHFDEVNIFKLIEENATKFRNRYSEIIFENLNLQPQPMENGLEIYRIDCIYKENIAPNNTYKFELQIKSQLMSAWADMEHQQYYKNYIFNPIRNTSQPIMNEVGKLIYQTEELLIRIRNSEREYKEIQEKLNFTSELGEKYSDFIQNSLTIHSEPMLTNIAGVLYILKDIITPNYDVIETILNSGYSYIPLDDPSEHSLYINLRDQDFQMQILEAVLQLWYKSNGKLSEGFLYTDYISSFNNDFLDALIKTYNLNALSENFKYFWYKLYESLPISDLYLNVTKYEDISAFFRQAHDEWEINFGQLVQANTETVQGEEHDSEEYDDNAEENLHEGLLTIILVYSIKKFQKNFDLSTLRQTYQISIENCEEKIIKSRLEALFNTIVATLNKSESTFLKEIKEVCISLVKG